MFTIGLRYCGGCNPQIDRARVIGDLKEGLQKQGLRISFSTEKQGDFDILLLMNGCMRACLEQEYICTDYKDQIISVKGEMVGREYVKEDHIPEFLIKKIVDLLNSPSH